MNLMLDNPAFRYYAICSVLLVIKMVFVGLTTAATRRKNGITLNLEDAQLLKVQHGAMEHPAVQRVLRIHRNDVENIPGFWIIGLIYVMTGASELAAQVYFPLYTLSRYAHTFFYLKEIQPWRTISFGVAQLCMVGMMVQILMRSIGAF